MTQKLCLYPRNVKDVMQLINILDKLFVRPNFQF
jgi:hypothetical protein